MKRPLLSSLMFFSALASANAKEVLSWEKTVEQTRTGNAQLQSANAALDVARYNERAAFGNYLPTASAGLGVSRARVNSDDTPYFSDAEESSTGFSAGLNIKQNLFAGFESVAKVEQARETRVVAEAANQIVKAEVSFLLKNAFQYFSFSQEFAKLTEDIIKRRSDNLRLVELRFESGRENKGSVLLSRADLADAKYADMQAKNQRRVSTAQLAQTLGRELSDDTEVVGNIPTVEPGVVPDFRTLAVDNPKHRQSVGQENVAFQGIKVARSNFLPDLNLEANFGQSGPDFFPANKSWNVGLSLSIPIFAGGQNYYGYQVASSSWVQAASNRLNTNRQLLATLTQTYTAYVEAVERFRVDTLYREAATLRAEIARNKYNNGLMTFEDWNGIENDLIDRQRKYLESQRNRVIAEAAWEREQGKGVIP